MLSSEKWALAFCQSLVGRPCNTARTALLYCAVAVTSWCIVAARC